jgi:hypothetical protein
MRAMNKVWALGICSLICAAVCACAQCDTFTRVLSKDNQGHTVWRIDKLCSGLLNGDMISIALSAAGGSKTTFFEYEDVSWDADYDDDQTTPSAKWIAPDHLEISIGAVGEIVQKDSKVGDITIMYQIGHIVKPMHD